MPIINNFDFENLKNEAEKFVLDELERQLATASGSVCHCSDCVLDMAAIALNTVKPLYRVSLLGALYAAHAMDEKNYASTVRDAVYSAIKKVSKNPGHDIN